MLLITDWTNGSPLALMCLTVALVGSILNSAIAISLASLVVGAFVNGMIVCPAASSFLIAVVIDRLTGGSRGESESSGRMPIFRVLFFEAGIQGIPKAEES